MKDDEYYTKDDVLRKIEEMRPEVPPADEPKPYLAGYIDGINKALNDCAYWVMAIGTPKKGK